VHRRRADLLASSPGGWDTVPEEDAMSHEPPAKPPPTESEKKLVPALEEFHKRIGPAMVRGLNKGVMRDK
jgi:hypothetical protein